MVTVSRVPAELSFALAHGVAAEPEELLSEMFNAVLGSLAHVAFCRRVTVLYPIGERKWLITISADYRETTEDDGTTTRERLYSWEAVEYASDPEDLVDSEEFSREIFATPAHALTDAVQFLKEHRTVLESVPAGAA